jgi:hypothetical protein
MGKVINILEVLFILLVLTDFVIYGINKVDDMNGPEPGQPKSVRDFNDFNVFFGAGEGVLKGKDIYFTPTSPEGRYFLYPPAFALYMSGVAQLGLWGASVYWYVVSMFMLLSSAWLISGILAQNRSARIAMAFLGIILVGRFIDSDFGNGNANIHVLFFLSLGVWCLAKNRCFSGGLSFGIAAIVKLTPIIFMGYFFWKWLISCFRKKIPQKDAFEEISPTSYWGQSLRGMIAALLLFTVILPSMVLGLQKNVALHCTFYSAMIHPYLTVSNAADKYWDSGYSAKTILLHYLTLRKTENTEGNRININLADWPQDVVWHLYLIISFLMVGLCLISWKNYTTRHMHTHSFPFALALELGSVVSLMVLISPLTRKAHFVVLLIPVIAALGAGLHPAWPKSRFLKRLLIWGAIIVGIIGTGTSTDVLGRHLFEIADAHVVLFWAGFAIWIACIISLLFAYRRD